MTEDEMVGWHYRLDGHQLWKLVMDGEDWHAAVHGSQRVGHDWATELMFSKISIDCQMDNRKSGGGVVGKGMKGNKIFNKDKGQCIISLGIWSDLQLKTSFWLYLDDGYGCKCWKQLCIYLNLGLPNYLQANQAQQGSVFANKVLLKHRCTHLFMYCL